MVNGDIPTFQCINALVSDGMEVGRDVDTIDRPLERKDMSTSTCHSGQTAHTMLPCS